MPEAQFIRHGMLFGLSDKQNLITWILLPVCEGKVIQTSGTIHISATYISDLVNACVDLPIDKEAGIRHLTNQGLLTYFGFAKALFLKKDGILR